MAMTSEQLEKMLSDYQTLNKAPEVSDEEFNDVSDKVNALQPLQKQPEIPIQDIPQIQQPLQPAQSIQAPIMPQQPELSQDEKEWQDAIKQRNLQQMLGHFQKAGELMGAGFARVAPITEGSKQTFDNASQTLNDYKAMREAKEKQFKLNLEKAMNDPKSDVSKAAREQAKKYGLNLPDNTPYSMAEKLMQESRLYKQSEDSLASRKLQAEALAEQRKQNQFLREETFKEKKHQNVEKDIDKHVSALAKSGVQEAMDIIQQLEDTLGTDLESSKELPGFGRVMGSVPAAALSGKAERVRQLKSRLDNITLKNQSGASVTDPEYKRYKEQAGVGLLKSEEATLNALRGYKKSVLKTLKSYEAGVDPEVLDVYKSRQGSVKDLNEVRKKEAENKQSLSKAQVQEYAKQHGIDEEHARQSLKISGYNVE